MKKSKIKNISIHRINMPQERKKEITDKLIYYHSKAIKQKLDYSLLTAKEKLNILLCK